MSKKVDIVLCIDKTGSMTPVADLIKAKIITILKNVHEKMGEEGSLRVKLITFGDYDFDDKPMEVSHWFTFGTDNDAIQDAVDAIQPGGGGDIPENGFEALWFAFHSDFAKRARKMVFLFTDARALDLGERADCPNYPKDMGSYEDLVESWKKLTCRKTLTIYAPSESNYLDLAKSCGDAQMFGVGVARGGCEITPDHLIKAALKGLEGEDLDED